jgi:hypothetical protein
VIEDSTDDFARLQRQFDMLVATIEQKDQLIEELHNQIVAEKDKSEQLEGQLHLSQDENARWWEHARHQWAWTNNPSTDNHRTEPQGDWPEVWALRWDPETSVHDGGQLVRATEGGWICCRSEEHAKGVARVQNWRSAVPVRLYPPETE